MGRFDMVKYDDQAVEDQKHFKDMVSDLENFIQDNLNTSRESSIALTKLEECYMWIGKALKQDTLKREGN